MSSGLNTLSGTIYEDFIADKMPKDISEKRISNIMKIISVVLGLVCMLFVFLVQFMGGLFQLTLKVTALAGGPILAIFTLGMLTPFVNTKVRILVIYYFIYHNLYNTFANATFFLGYFMGYPWRCMHCCLLIIWSHLL